MSIAIDLAAAREADREAERNDYCSEVGAKALKQHLEAYWLERGHAVQANLHHAGFLAIMRTARTDVRSDMRNGFPPKHPALPAALPASKKAAA